MRTAVFAAATALVLAAGPGPATAQSSDGFPKLAFLQKPQKDGVEKKWKWPSLDVFETRWTVDTSPVIRLVRGKLTRGETVTKTRVVLAVWPTEGGVELGVVDADDQDAYYTARGTLAGVWTAPTLRPGKLRFVQGDTTLVLDADYVSPARAKGAAAWTDWTYTTTLVQPKRPIRVDTGLDRYQHEMSEATKANWEKVEKLVRADDEAAVELLWTIVKDNDTGPASWHWEKALAFARQHDKALAREIYARYSPVGRCSMDSRPQEVAREYADLCFEMKDLGCTLSLSVQIIGDQFNRVAYSSYGEAAHATGAERLAETGLDTPRFLRGLLFQFAGGDERRELYPWRLSRAMIEAGETARFEALLTGIATDDDVDEHNRFRATATLTYLWARSSVDRKKAFEKIATVDGLSPISAAWAKRMAATAAE